MSFETLSQSVVAGNESQVKETVKSMLTAGVNPLEIIQKGLIAGMNIVGPLFKAGDMYVPEVLMSAKSMAAGIEIVKPNISDADMPSEGTIVVGTVKGDLHDIGKNLVGMMLESAGFKVIDLGVDISAEKFMTAVKEHKANILAMSALLTTTMLAMKDTIELIKEEGMQSNVKVIVGGAPVSQEFANQIGADGFAVDAATAVELCRTLIA